MKRWITHLGIGAYLLALLIGFAVHAVESGGGCSPLMYFVVWDMFCGWSAYESRMEVIGEGESGKFYSLAPGPWGEFHPYGFIARHHYDPEFRNGERIGHNTLKHTVHEPMVRLFIVEVEYPKKLNIPDDRYLAYYGRPKEYRKYYHTRFVVNPQGDILSQQPVWLRYQAQIGLQDNPRLISDAKHHHRFLASPQIESRGAFVPGSILDSPSEVSSIPILGN